MKATKGDKKILRRLGRKYAEIAHHRIQGERKALWYKHNALEPEKIMVLTYPGGGWEEIISGREFRTSNEEVRQWEGILLSTIYAQEHFKDDQVAEPVFNVAPVVSFSDYGVPFKPIKSISGRRNRGAYRWDPPVKTEQDFKKLHFRTVKVDHEEIEQRMELAKEIFGGILKVRKRGAFGWPIGMTWSLIQLRGLDQMMLDMCDNPEFLHKLMAFLRDSTLNEIEVLESEGVLSLNNENDEVGSGGVGYTDELPASDYNGKVRPCDMWILGESQESVGVSPAMFDEFVLQYQMPVMETFGLVCYGCCEPLDARFGLIKKNIPCLRRVSVSPWCNVNVAREALEDKYIFSWKPNPAMIAGNQFDEDAVRAYIRTTVEAARGCVLEIVLKDTHTCRKEPQRFDEFTRIAQEVAGEAS